MQILFTDRVLQTIRRMDKNLGKVSLLSYSPKITVAYGELCVYFAVQIPPFVDWTWMAEMTLSLKVDLVLSDMALELLANSVRHNLFNRCCHFAYGEAAMWLKCTRHLKNAIFTQTFAMSMTPVVVLKSFSFLGLISLLEFMGVRNSFGGIVGVNPLTIRCLRLRVVGGCLFKYMKQKSNALQPT